MKGFEDLDVWKEGCKIAIAIYDVTSKGHFLRDFGLQDQLRRCAVSIPSNIAEGKERESIKELIRYLYIAKGSSAELRTQLVIANKIGYLTDKLYIELSSDAITISRMLGSFIRKLKENSKAKKA